MSDEIRYTKTHEWLMPDESGSGLITFGLTPFKLKSLGDIVYIILKPAGAGAGAGEEIAVIEAVKAASEIPSPLTCEIAETNTALTKDTDRIPRGPADSWLYKLRPSGQVDLADFMDEKGYEAFLREQSRD
jgi:glycine cleavage system H protein